MWMTCENCPSEKDTIYFQKDGAYNEKRSNVN